MAATALFLTFSSGCAMASVFMLVSSVARDRVSFFQFYTVSNITAGIAALLLFARWNLVPSIAWGPVLLTTGAIGLVNVMSQGALVCSLKWGHNGLSVAIRNSSAMLTMLWGVVFLHEKISIINFTGVLTVIAALAVIAISGKKKNVASNLKKWIPAVICSLLLSGIYQILFSCTALLPENVHKGGVLIPCLMTFCGLGNFLAALVEHKFAPRQEKFFHFDKKIWQVMLCWIAMALIQYFLLVRALASMQKAGMAALAWPMLVGINVTSFTLFCRLKWKEKYPLQTVIAIAGCVLGLILIIWGRK